MRERKDRSRSRRKVVLVVALVVFVLALSGNAFWEWYSGDGVVLKDDFQEVLGRAEPVEIEEEVKPVSGDFGLVIPRLGINVPVIANVDGGNPKEYLWQVTRGVAHFKHREYADVIVDGSLPGEGGNIFLFGHSQIPGRDTGNFQGVFNGLSKLNSGDRIYVYYQDDPYVYRVSEKKVISKRDLSYLKRTPQETLTLMTCWPLGLDIRRYIIRAKRFE